MNAVHKAARPGMTVEAFIVDRAKVLELSLTLEDQAAREGDLWWAAHFAQRAADAAEAAWAAAGQVRE